VWAARTHDLLPLPPLELAASFERGSGRMWTDSPHTTWARGSPCSGIVREPFHTWLSGALIIGGVTQLAAHTSPEPGALRVVCERANKTALRPF